MASTFLDGALIALDSRNMFIVGRNVKLYVQIGNIITKRLKLAITKDECNLESSSFVQANNVRNMFEDSGVLHVIELRCSAKFYMLRDAHQKRNGVNLYDVNG